MLLSSPPTDRAGPAQERYKPLPPTNSTGEKAHLNRKSIAQDGGRLRERNRQQFIHKRGIENGPTALEVVSQSEKIGQQAQDTTRLDAGALTYYCFEKKRGRGYGRRSILRPGQIVLGTVRSLHVESIGRGLGH